MVTERVILWSIVVAYILFVFSKGVWKARKIHNSDDFLVAGRNVGWFLLFCTMGATVIGGGASIGAIGRTYDWGVLMLLVSTGWYFHFIFSGLVVAPKFREAKLYTVAGYFGHRFGEAPRFAMLVLSLLFSVFIIAAQMAAFGSVLAAILPEFAESQSVLRWAIIVGGGMVVVYSTAGGLLAVIHTDMYQFIVLILGFTITLFFCIPDIADSYQSDQGQFIPKRFGKSDIAQPAQLAERILSGADPVSSAILDSTMKDRLLNLRRAVARESAEATQVAVAGILNAQLGRPEFYSADRFAAVALSAQTRALLDEAEPSVANLRRRNLSLAQDAYSAEIGANRAIPARFFELTGGRGWVFLITTFLAFLLGETFAPGYATRYCVGKDIRQTRIGIAGVGFFLALTFPAVLFFIALYARIHFPDIDPQQALPMVVRQLNNPIIGGLIIGALLMAVMSSADSALNSSTAIFVKDLFEHQLGWVDKGDGGMLRLARLFSVLLGGVSILIAVAWSDIIALLLFTYHVWAPAVILPVCVGALTQWKGRGLSQCIFITMLTATAATLLYRVLLYLFNEHAIRLAPEGWYTFMSAFDPSVFGVVISCLVFFGLWPWFSARDRAREAG